MTPGRRPRPQNHGVGNMDAVPIAARRVKSIGRNSSRVYCPSCGAKKKQGKCPRCSEERQP